jgi:N-acetylmuramoyl-L-alanine amidase
MYKTVEEKSPHRKTDEKTTSKKLSLPVLFLIPTILLILLLEAIMGAIAGLTSQPEMLENGALKLEAIATEDRQINELKKNEQATVESESKKGDFEAKKEKQENAVTEPDNINNDIIFKVQALSSKNPLGSNSPKFKGLKNVWEYKDGGLYKYTIGNQRDIRSASVLKSELRKKGFSDAFVVAFKNGKRIPVKEALILMN